MGENIAYTCDELTQYYCTHRNSWKDFYPSEHAIFELVAGHENQLGRVLDAGCGAGGLGRALQERFSLDSYTGVDIHGGMIEAGRRMGGYTIPAELAVGDVAKCDTLDPEGYDNVVSLSCADWNVKTLSIISTCWNHVKPGGNFILTLRLTTGPSATDLETSFQYICFEDEPPRDKEGLEIAPYVVFNVQDGLNMLARLEPTPSLISARGYWGTPSPTAVTPYERLLFTALAVRKPCSPEQGQGVRADLQWPLDVFL